MKISSIEEYGVRCLVQLARHEAEGSGSLAISELARLEGLSVPYVGKLMGVLRKAGLVRSERGQQGGYTLARPATAIRLDEAMRALADPIYYPGFCTEHSGGQDICVHVRDCGLRAVWREVQAAVDQVTARVRLSDLVGPERPLTSRLRTARATGEMPLPLAGAADSALEACVTCSTCACDDDPAAGGSAAPLTISYPPRG